MHHTVSMLHRQCTVHKRLVSFSENKTKIVNLNRNDINGRHEQQQWTPLCTHSWVTLKCQSAQQSLINAWQSGVATWHKP